MKESIVIDFPLSEIGIAPSINSGVLLSMLSSDVLPTSCFVSVEAFVGRGKVVADTKTAEALSCASVNAVVPSNDKLEKLGILAKSVEVV